MDIQEIARNTFTIAALLLTATVVLLNYFWKRLKALIATMPEGKQRVMLCRLKSISDPVEREKYTYINLQFLACVFVILSFAGALIAVSFMPSVMVGDTAGYTIAENFEFAVVTMRAAVFCLFAGILFSAAVYLEDLIAMYTGGPSITTTKLEELQKRPPKDKVWSHLLFGLLQAYLVILFLIEVFVPFNQWVKMTIAIVVGIVLILGTRFGYRVYVRAHSRHIPTTEKPDGTAS
jgi:hypothetical protein